MVIQGAGVVFGSQAPGVSVGCAHVVYGGQLIPFALTHNVPFKIICFTVCVSILLLRKDCIHLSFIVTLFIVESNNETALLLYLWDKCKISVDY